MKTMEVSVEARRFRPFRAELVHSTHNATENFYYQMLSLTDKVIESYQVDNGKIMVYGRLLDESLPINDYLKQLRDLCQQFKKEYITTEEHLIDEIISLISSTLYKLSCLSDSDYSYNPEKYDIPKASYPALSDYLCQDSEC